MKIDTWCFAQAPDGKRRRGRLVEHGSRLLLLTAGPTVLDLGALATYDLRAKTATTDEGVIRWQHTCSCGWPTSLKGPVDAILAKVKVPT
jgi:hypothetical protein